MRLKKGPPDFVLFLTVLALTAIGLVMVFSASAVTAGVWYNDPYHFFKRQLLWACVGIIAMIVVMKLNYLRIKEFALPLFIITMICLVLVVTPLGIDVKGSSRWLGVGILRVSPSELAKIGVVMFLAKTLDVKLDNITSLKNGVAPYILLIALVCGLIMLQPDLGTSFAIAATVFFMLMVAGARWSHLGMIAASGLGVVAALIAVAPYRMERFIAFLNPWKYARDEGFQTIQSLYALGSGGLFGMGLGRSRQKFF